MITGIDVSHHNEWIDWPKVRQAGVRFAIIKASEGIGFTDTLFEQNLKGALDAGILPGSYHFFLPRFDPLAQARHYVRVLQENAMNAPTLPPVIDLETAGLTKPALNQAVKVFLGEILNLTGRRGMLYVSPGFWSAYLPVPVFSGYKLVRSDVDWAAGQPTASAHYNNLRKDALYFGNAAADTVSLGAFVNRFAFNLSLIYLATNRLRVPYVANKPCAIVINGYALKATANIDLPASMFSGVATTWYIFAVRTAGSTTFTLTVNTSPVEGTDQRLIGECYWDGSTIGAILCYFSNTSFPDADYDSGWFAVGLSTTYTKAHGLSGFPRLVLLFHATDAAGTSEWVLVTVVQSGSANDLAPLGWTSGNILASSSSAAGATIQSSRRVSAVGYWRILAWN